ncbi:MAG: ATP-binding cassette domain-containing protein [Proteobacteria bacterium]|nr:ATP-binding cassette domain-containing protein [Pseudomonadota bacterium]
MLHYISKFFDKIKKFFSSVISDNQKKSIEISSSLIIKTLNHIDHKDKKVLIKTLAAIIGLNIFRQIFRIQETRFYNLFITESESNQHDFSIYIFMLCCYFTLSHFNRIYNNKISLLLSNHSIEYCFSFINLYPEQNPSALNHSTMREDIMTSSSGVFSLSQSILDILDSILGIVIQLMSIKNYDNEKNATSNFNINKLILLYWISHISLKIYSRNYLFEYENQEYKAYTKTKSYLDEFFQKNELVIMENLKDSEEKKLHFLLRNVFSDGSNRFNLASKIILYTNLLYPLFLSFWLSGIKANMSSILTAIKIFNDMTGYVNILNDSIVNFFPTIRKIALIENVIQYPVLPMTNPLLDFDLLKSFYINEIELRNVNFSYRGNQILDDINLKFSSGSTSFIIGKNESGKSTLLKIIAGLYKPDSGHVLNNGVNIWQNNSYIISYRQNVSYCPQNHQTWIFDGSIKENLSSDFNDDAKDELKFIDISNTSLDEKIERNKFSGGKAQRLLLARAILKNSTMFIFDEANSELDNHSRMKVFEEIMEKTKNKTRVIVTHHFVEMHSFFKKADQIILLEKGKILSIGKDDDLKAKSGFYNSLWT